MMRIVTFEEEGSVSWGIEKDGAVVDSRAFKESNLPGSVLELIQLGDNGLGAVEAVFKTADWHRASPLSSFKLLAPLPNPPAIIGVGANYRDHAREAGLAPHVPVFFAKSPASLTGAGSSIWVDSQVTTKADYEAELAVVIGRNCRHVTAEDAQSAIFGYTILNDVSARDVQLDRPFGQWFLGKSLDTFCPMGPVLVTRDELSNVSGATIETRVNGEMRQQARVEDMVFSVEELVSTLSRYITIQRGTVIATGTPGGVGMAMSPPCFLENGDVIEISISGIGTLHNTVVGE